MAGDKFDQLYNALKADGAVSGTREHFRQFVYAPGKQGYHNRKQLYDALHADGAVSSKSYEEFAQRLGLHAVNPKPQQQKPLTMKQRAQEVAAQYQQSRQRKAQQPVDYLHRAGRCGRDGSKAVCASVITENDISRIKSIQKTFRVNMMPKKLYQGKIVRK